MAFEVVEKLGLIFLLNIVGTLRKRVRFSVLLVFIIIVDTQPRSLSAEGLLAFLARVAQSWILAVQQEKKKKWITKSNNCFSTLGSAVSTWAFGAFQQLCSLYVYSPLCGPRAYKQAWLPNKGFTSELGQDGDWHETGVSSHTIHEPQLRFLTLACREIKWGRPPSPGFSPLLPPLSVGHISES